MRNSVAPNSLLRESGESVIGKWRRDVFAVTPSHPGLVSVQPGEVQNNVLRRTREKN